MQGQVGNEVEKQSWSQDVLRQVVEASSIAWQTCLLGGEHASAWQRVGGTGAARGQSAGLKDIQLPGGCHSSEEQEPLQPSFGQKSLKDLMGLGSEASNPWHLPTGASCR